MPASHTSGEEAGNILRKQRKEKLTMTPGLDFINQYLVHAPHMRNYFASLCPALTAEVKNEPELITQPQEETENSHA
jgi:hypothetical protein